MQNELTLIYESNEETSIKLFSEEFVSKNKDKCSLVIEGTSIDLTSNYTFNKMGKHVVILLNPKNDIVDMSYMFNQCEWLRSLSENSKWKTDNVTNMNHLFSFCKELYYSFIKLGYKKCRRYELNVLWLYIIIKFA